MMAFFNLHRLIGLFHPNQGNESNIFVRIFLWITMSLSYKMFYVKHMHNFYLNLLNSSSILSVKIRRLINIRYLSFIGYYLYIS